MGRADPRAWLVVTHRLGDTVFVTSAISAKPFKQPTTGLFGNDYIAELQAQGLSGEEIMKRVQARDNELLDEAADVGTCCMRSTRDR